MDRADTEIRTINSVGGQIRNAVYTPAPKDRHSNEKVDKNEDKKNKVKDKKQKKLLKKQEKDNKKKQKLLGAAANKTIPTEISVLSPEAQRDVIEVEDDIDHLSDVLHTLKKKALIIGEQADESNARFDALNQSMTGADLRIRHQNVKIKNLAY